MRATIPLGRALLLIFSSVFLVVTCFFLSWFYTQQVKKWRAQDPHYHLFAIVQTGPEKEALKTVCLAELMGLSIDAPTNLYAFDCQEARRRLLSLSVIKSAQVRTLLPGIVYVDYTKRKPVAYLSDYSNTSLDASGVMMPSSPFFTPKRIPSLYLGLGPLERIWGTRVKGEKIQLAFSLQSLISQLLLGSTQLRLIDVSQIDAPSLGQREIVVHLEEHFERRQEGKSLGGIQSIWIRLNPTHYLEALGNYLELRPYLKQRALKNLVESELPLPDLTIDMRLPQLAYVTPWG